MAIPKKKRRIITVDQTEYYWRKESNRCLYIETGQSPNFIIKGYFEKGYFAAPQVVRAVIDYIHDHKIDTQPFVIIENAHELFKAELERHQQKENEKSDERIIESKKRRSEEGWNFYHLAKKGILERDYCEALDNLMSSIMIDSSKKERWSLLENFISEDLKNAELLTMRAITYRRLSRYPEYQSLRCISRTSL